MSGSAGVNSCCKILVYYSGLPCAGFAFPQRAQQSCVNSSPRGCRDFESFGSRQREKANFGWLEGINLKEKFWGVELENEGTVNKDMEMLMKLLKGPQKR
jgi:hypothetical protein